LVSNRRKSSQQKSHRMFDKDRAEYLGSIFIKQESIVITMVVLIIATAEAPPQNMTNQNKMLSRGFDCQRGWSPRQDSYCC